MTKVAAALVHQHKTNNTKQGCGRSEEEGDGDFCAIFVEFSKLCYPIRARSWPK